MSNEAFDFSTIKLLREHPGLDFVNSTANHQNSGEDYLKTYADLVSWGLNVELLSADEAQSLFDFARQQPAQATALYQQAVALREAVRVRQILEHTVLAPHPAVVRAMKVIRRGAARHQSMAAMAASVVEGFDRAIALLHARLS